MLAVVIFLFDSLTERRSVPLAKQSGTACLKNSCKSSETDIVETKYLLNKLGRI